MFFELPIHQRFLEKLYHGFHQKVKQQQNISWAANLHIKMISEGSCDPEDWSNDAENTDLHHRSNIENTYLKLKSYFTILMFYSITYNWLFLFK